MATEPAPFRSANLHGVEIAFRGDVTQAVPPELLDALEGSIREFIARCQPARFATLKLIIEFTEWNPGFDVLQWLTKGLLGRANCKAAFSGETDDTNIAFSVSAKARDTTACIRSMLDTIEDQLTWAGDVPESTSASLWRRMIRLTFLAAGACFVAMFALFRLHPRRTPSKMHFTADMILAALAGLLMVGTMLSVSLLRMPDSFYRNDPAGLRVSRLCGSQDPFTVRVVAVFFALLSSAFLCGFVYLFLNDARR